MIQRRGCQIGMVWYTRVYSYLEAEAVVRELCVVNETAERGVALMQDYNCLLTKDEDQIQFALQVVKGHRSKFPDSEKSTVVDGLAATNCGQLR